MKAFFVIRKFESAYSLFFLMSGSTGWQDWFCCVPVFSVVNSVLLFLEREYALHLKK